MLNSLAGWFCTYQRNERLGLPSGVLVLSIEAFLHSPLLQTIHFRLNAAHHRGGLQIIKSKDILNIFLYFFYCFF